MSVEQRVITDYTREYAICPQCGYIRPPGPLCGYNIQRQECDPCENTGHWFRTLGLAELAEQGKVWGTLGYPNVARQYQRRAAELQAAIAQAA